jgi:DNA-binding GntR family transcriptional regulator
VPIQSVEEGAALTFDPASGPGPGHGSGRRRRDGAAHRLVRDGLRNQILRGELAPGQRLVEADLADQFGVTRASVRSALIELTSEGMVERPQHRGARVRVVTLDEAIEITECRMALEGLCAAKAAEQRTGPAGGELLALVQSMREVVAAGDVLAYSDLNHRLHQRIREISGQRTAAQTIERLRGQSVRHQFRLALQPGRSAASLLEHERIVAAILNRDPAAAEQAMRTHLRSVIEALKAAAQHDTIAAP